MSWPRFESEREARARAARIIEAVEMRCALELGLATDMRDLSKPRTSRDARRAEVKRFKRKLAALTTD
jgi:hypothetical protein